MENNKTSRTIFLLLVLLFDFGMQFALSQPAEKADPKKSQPPQATLIFGCGLDSIDFVKTDGTCQGAGLGTAIQILWELRFPRALILWISLKAGL